MSGASALLRWITLRHLAGSKLRALLTVFGIALGVAMVVGTTAANRAILGAFDELADRAAGKADLEIVADESGVEQSVLEALVDRPELAAHAAGRVEQTTLLADGTRVLVVGIDFLGDLAFAPFRTREGDDPFRDALGFVADPHAILVTDSLARARGLKVGSTLDLRTAQGVERFTVEAILEETGASSAYGGQVVILGLDAAQLAFAREGKLDRIDVSLPAGVAFDAGRAALQGFVGSRGAVERPSKRAASLARMTDAFRGGLSITAIVAVLVGMFLVYNAIGVAVSQRRREIGVVRGLGASRRAVLAVFLGEAFVLGLFGGAIGVALGAGLAKAVVSQFAPNVSRFFENIAAPTVRVDARLVGSGLALGILASLIAAWVPARRAASIPPIESMRRDEGAISKAGPRKGALLVLAVVLSLTAAIVVRKPTAGSGLVSLLCLFVAASCAAPATVDLLARRLGPVAQALFGAAPRLGVEGVGRALGRSAQTVSALTLATALGLTLSTYTHSYERTCLAWVEQAIPADVVVSAGSPLLDRNAIAFSPAWKDAVEATPGVASVNLVRAISVPYGDLRVEVLSIESETYLARLAGSDFRHVVRGPARLPVDALSRDPSILISENFAWKTGLGPGDHVELASPTGPHRFRIAAVVVDYSNDQGWMLIDRRWALDYWKDPRVEAIHVYSKPGVDPAALAIAIRARVAQAQGEGGLFVTTNAALKAEIRQVIEQTFGISKAAETIAMIVAVLGVIGTMIAAVLDRRREIGVLRAIGASRRQVLSMIAVEAATLGACAGLLAALVSVPASKVFVDVVAFQASGWSVPLVFPVVAWLRVVLGVTLLAGLSGLLPGASAARLVVGRALAYE